MADARLSQGRVRTLLADGAGEARAAAVRVRTLITFPAEEAQLSQARARTLLTGGTEELQLSSARIRLLVKRGGDIRQLRAWTFTQDDHDFYVIQLTTGITLVFDKLSGQWAHWRSPGYTYWRGADGVQWEGWNVTCDTESGILWEIDPEGRLDNETTPIVSVVTGGMSGRMRKFIDNFMAELAVSEGHPPTGFDDGSVGITLRTSDDQGISFVSHGEVTGEGIGEEMTVRWYGLGSVNGNGRIYEITDTGYARRIDGFNVEVGDENGGN